MANPNNNNNNNTGASKGNLALPLGVLFSAAATGCFYFAWQKRNIVNAIKQAPSFKSTAELKAELEKEPGATKYIKLYGNVNSDKPLLVDVDGIQENVLVKENTIHEKAMNLRSITTKDQFSEFSRSEQRADIHIAPSNSSERIVFPQRTKFELDTVKETETSVGSSYISALVSLIGFKYSYAHISRTNVLRPNTHMFVAGKVLVDDDILAFKEPSFGFFAPKPQPFVVTRKRENEVIDEYKKSEKYLSIFSAAFGIIGIGLLAVSQSK